MDMKAVRKQLGLTQEELSKLVHIQPRQIRNVESGKHPVPALVAEKLERLAANFRA